MGGGGYITVMALPPLPNSSARQPGGWGGGCGGAASNQPAGTCCAEVNAGICPQVLEVEFRVDKMPLSEGDLSNWARFISLGMNILRSADREKDIMRAPLATSTGSIEPVPRELLCISFVLVD